MLRANVVFILVYSSILVSTTLLCLCILTKLIVCDFITFLSFCMEIIIA